jgi:ABC-type bacteriocin/lantibiotic exporter with double-glycine peptidase domain
MMYAVPLVSQYALTGDPYWKIRNCGIAALLMVLRFYIPELKTSGDELFRLALAKGAHLPNVGWKHRELAQTAEEFGLQGANYDWFGQSPEYAFEMLLHELKKGPVIASVHKNFNLENGGHLVVVTGYENGTVYINEPAEEDIKKVPQQIPRDVFLRGWKRRIIVVRKKS